MKAEREPHNYYEGRKGTQQCKAASVPSSFSTVGTVVRNKVTKTPVTGIAAQLVERPTETPGAMLTRVRVPGATRDFCPKVNSQRSLSYGVRTAPVCNRRHQYQSVRTLNIPGTLAAIQQCLDTRRTILHTLIGMGSAARAAAVPYPGKATRTALPHGTRQY